MCYFILRGKNMTITATELKTNIGRYLETVKREDIVITKNGKKIARIVREEDDRITTAKSLFGILPSSASLEEIKSERRKRYESNR
jgi:prevent-host-death family protein